MSGEHASMREISFDLDGKRHRSIQKHPGPLSVGLGCASAVATLEMPARKCKKCRSTQAAFHRGGDGYYMKKICKFTILIRLMNWHEQKFAPQTQCLYRDGLRRNGH
jgi:hypothetical protein